MCGVVQFEGELNGADYTLTMKAQGTTEVHASYTQSITPSLAIGGDSTYDFQHGMGVMSVGGKYSGADWSAAGLVMSMGAVSGWLSVVVVLLLAVCRPPCH